MGTVLSAIVSTEVGADELKMGKCLGLLYKRLEDVQDAKNHGESKFMMDV